MGPARQFKPAVAQTKSAVSAQGFKRPVPPPVYKAHNVQLQVNPLGMKRSPTAPPVYRPNAAQPKMAQARPSAIQPKLNAARLAAPAVYRPQSSSPQAQLKAGNTAQMKTKPVARPAYRPQPIPKVLQTKQASAAAATRPMTTSQGKVAPPIYQPNGSRGVMQRRTVAGDGRVAQNQRPAKPLASLRQMPVNTVQRQTGRTYPFGLGRAVVQMRGSNPYAAGGGVTSHHIIPHSTLVATLGQLTAQQRTTVLRQFLPPFDGLTIETLINAAITDAHANPFQIHYLGAVKTQYDIAHDNPAGFQALARKPFSQFTGAEQLATTFDNVTFANFQIAYNNQRNGTGGTPSEKEEVMLEAFFEWQSGNQFYGSTRYEPGTSNDFDSDAQYVLGSESYVSDLSTISTSLKQTQSIAAPLTLLQQQQLMATFTTLAGKGTAGKAIPAVDDSQWFNLDTNVKQELLEIVEGYSRVTASGIGGHRRDNYKVHKDIIRRAYNRPSGTKGSKSAWHAVYEYLRNDGIVAVPAAVAHPTYPALQIVASSGKYLGIQGTTTKVLVNHGRGMKMDDIWSALGDLADVFKAWLKDAFDFLT